MIITVKTDVDIRRIERPFEDSRTLSGIFELGWDALDHVLQQSKYLLITDVEDKGVQHMIRVSNIVSITAAAESPLAEYKRNAEQGED